ncbi:MAG TPA: formate--tetrahydrofolate ligase [Rhizomicrobium sp.]|jgi:formate--tetrahydrofolate ligase|nr:formate--tetrahydrofolate ligase [Rhizomicrobium sp.]
MSDLEIARATVLRLIEDVGATIGLPASALYRHGPYKAKIALEHIATLPDAPRGKLILVTAISPTPAGEGKTTTTIGLGDALARLGKKTVIALREPSLGPCFGQKGGATGGGHAQVAPMDEINLHLTGDFHAITAANNLLAALVDNHIYWGNKLGIDPSRVTWRRAMDMNDRALRDIVVGLRNNGQIREDGFDITVASEVMAIFCLATSLTDLEARLGRIIVARTFDKRPVTAAQLEAAGAMTALLRDAFQPNLVQTLEHTPALIHGGPFANIAHGCNTVMATRTALALGDYVVTEAGFGADLGAEKFFDIKCRQANLEPDAAVIVATVRALKMHGGVARADLARENVEAVRSGAANLLRHIANVRKFGVPVTVAINHFTGDSAAEMAVIAGACCAVDANVHECRHWAQGGRGAEALAREVVALTAQGGAAFKPLYPDSLSLEGKMRTVAQQIYRAEDIAIASDAQKKLDQFAAEGFGHLPVCMAKTQYSFSADPTLLGAPEGFILPIRDVRLSAGAGFVVALCGAVMTMPGLPRVPAANRIHVNADGLIEGLF